jgi:hypothetical protein
MAPMLRPVAAVGAVAAIAAAAALSVTASPAVAIPSDLRCLTLVAGSTGLPVELPGPGGGLGAVASPDVALPGAIVFRTARETFGREYAFALRAGRIYARAATLGRSAPGVPWRELTLPDCLRGTVTAISADDRLLLATTRDRTLFSHAMKGGDLSASRWTWRWGPYFWTGLGATLPGDVGDWAASEFNGDEHFTDTAGRQRNPIGVATAYLLHGDGRITYLDPWLPPDDSREVCGPRRGTVPLAALSGSGSTVFVAGRRGELYTRLYDFDVSGANTVVGAYSWQQDRPASDPRWQLPAPGWVRHARPPRARITDRITIAKTGRSAADRLLRVEGRDRRGRVGYFEKALTARAWRFVATGGALQGTRLPRARPFSSPDDRRYAAPGMEVHDFNPECSPATLHVDIGAGLDLLLHSSDGLRQETRARGLDDTPREYNGAIEVPRGVFDRLAAGDPRKAWIDAQLGGRRIATAPLAVTATRLRFHAQCWELTRDGRAARPDSPRVPPDLGTVVARLNEQRRDGRPPDRC